MTNSGTLAIVGATGLVGNELIVLLDQFSKGSELLKLFQEVRLFASKDSIGEVYKVGDDEVVVEELTAQSFEGVSLAIFATQPDLAAEFIPRALSAGSKVVDCSGVLRSVPEVPVVIPEVNARVLTRETTRIAVPSAAVVQLAPVLMALHERAGVRRVFLTALESVSGAGKLALDELWSQNLAIFNQRPVETEQFEHQIAFNCIPQVDTFVDSGATREEDRIVSELRTVLMYPTLPVSVTAVRVPVLYGHAHAVHIECERPLSPAEACKCIADQRGIQVSSQHDEYPMPLTATGSEEIFVGRMRSDPALQNGLAFWVVADNVRRGVALNALRIVELLGESFAN